MKRFKNILYFADGERLSGKAFERAVGLARSNQARLCIFDAVAKEPTPPGMSQRLDEALREMREESLTEMLTQHSGARQQPEVEVVTGVGFVEVIRAVQRDNYDLVIKASRTVGGISERLLGSTDMHLLRKCPCPVWIERPDKAPSYQTILAAVDPETPEGHDCSVKVLTMAASMAQRDNAQLMVVHAWHLYGESALKSGFSKVSKTELEMLLQETELRHRAMLKSLVRECGLDEDDCDIQLVKGAAAETIRQLSERYQADLIVMGTVGRCGIPGFIIGNTAETVLQSTAASILAVKPDAFVSPVTPG